VSEVRRDSSKVIRGMEYSDWGYEALAFKMAVSLGGRKSFRRRGKTKE
jgi:hypothetical protein